MRFVYQSTKIMTTHTQTPPSQQWNRYPLDLANTYKSQRALAVYHDRLAREEHEIFVSEGKPRFLDLWQRMEDENDFQPETRISSQEQLDKTMGETSLDPNCRFIFLYTESSRGKLCCTRDQLNRVLAHHEVMPSFLDFCFEFKNKENPTTSTMFRFEDHHFVPHRTAGGPRIQHAFNIIAPEEDRRHDPLNPWLIRHTTVYHSFDLAQARSTWITIKGNRMIRERITSTGKSLQLNRADTAQEQGTALFAFSLSTHVQVLEWCTEGWSGYVDHLEERVRKHATAIKLAPVEALSRKPPRKKPLPRLGPNPATTGLSQFSVRSSGPQPLGIGGRIRSNLSRMASGFSGNSRTTTVTDADSPTGLLEDKAAADDGEQLDSIFTFDDLQKIRQVTDDAEQAAMVLRENHGIIIAIQDRYQNLSSALNTGYMSTRCNNLDLGSVETLITGFVRQLSVCRADLESHEARVQVLLRSLERNEEMFQGILQYGNMRVGEYYARSAEASAETMEKWTVAMHQIAAETEHETVSMHGITVLTLIFLPGTFVSTLFSSGIWSFDSSQSHSMGDWETRVPALKLFLAISLPLMALALAFWWITYRWAKGKHRVPSDWIPDALKSSGPAGPAIKGPLV